MLDGDRGQSLLKTEADNCTVCFLLTPEPVQIPPTKTIAFMPQQGSATQLGAHLTKAKHKSTFNRGRGAFPSLYISHISTWVRTSIFPSPLPAFTKQWILLQNLAECHKSPVRKDTFPIKYNSRDEGNLSPSNHCGTHIHTPPENIGSQGP